MSEMSEDEDNGFIRGVFIRVMSQLISRFVWELGTKCWKESQMQASVPAQAAIKPQHPTAMPTQPASAPTWQHKPHAKFYRIGNDYGINKVISFSEAQGAIIRVRCPGPNGTTVERELELVRKVNIKGILRVPSGRIYRVPITEAPNSPKLRVTIFVLPASFRAGIDHYTGVAVSEAQARTGGTVAFKTGRGDEHTLEIRPHTFTGQVYRGHVPDSAGKTYVFIRTKHPLEG